MTNKKEFSHVYSPKEIDSTTFEYIKRYYKKSSTPICFMHFSEKPCNFRIKDQTLVKGDFFDGYEMAEVFYVTSENDIELIKASDLSTFKFIALPDFLKTQEKTPLTPALFLDRDGVINVNTHYPHKPQELQLIQEIIPIAKHYEEKGFKIIVTTNQSGIGRGLFKEEDYQACVNRINDFFKENGLDITAHYHCPYHRDGVKEFAKDSLFRKPKPGMFLKAAREHGIDIHQSVMIGDNLSDVIDDIALKAYVIGENSPNELTHENFLSLI